MDGMSNDHTEAATITPEAKPNSDFCKRGDMSFFMKKTNEAPSIVPNNGINNPIVIPMATYLLSHHLFHFLAMLVEGASARVLPTESAGIAYFAE